MTMTTALAILLLGSLWMIREYGHFYAEAERARKEELAARETALKQTVLHLRQQIQTLQPEMLEQARQRVRLHVAEAAAFSKRICEYFEKTRSQNEIAEIVRESLRTFRFDEGRGYFFAADTSGVQHLFVMHPELEGRNLIAESDSHESRVLRLLIDTVQKGGDGFCRYQWTKPDAGDTLYEKESYVTPLEPLGWFIGAGFYPDEVEKETKRRALEILNGVVLENNGYAFAGQWDGVSLAGPARGQNMWNATDTKGRKVVQELVKKARTGGGFVTYEMPTETGQGAMSKISYVTALPEWQWYVGAGVYVEDIEAAYARSLALMHSQLMFGVATMISVLIALLAISYALAQRTARKIAHSLGVLNAFFRKAADESIEMNVNDVEFSELRGLARYANRMVADMRREHEALIENRAMLQHAERLAALGTFRHYPISSQTVWSAELYRIHGLDPAQPPPTQEGQRAFVFERDWPTIIAKMQESLDSRMPVETEYRIRRADGAVRTLHAACEWSFDSAGHPLCFAGAVQDITERKEAETALRESEARYRALFDGTTDVVFLTRGLSIVQCNTRALEMFRCDRAQLEDKTAAEFSPEHQPNGALSKTAGEKYMRAAIEGQPQMFEWQHRRADGTLFDAEVSLNAVDIQAERHVLAIVRDISQRKRAEEERARLAVAIEQAAEDIVITDANGAIEYVNPAFERIIGYSREEVIGHTPAILKSGRHDRAFYENLWTTIKSGRVWTGRIINRCKDGHLVQEEAAISPILDTRGRITGYVSVKRDITQEVRLENQLRQAQKMEAIGTLAGGIAHDFNNILSGIMGYAEMALMDLPEDHKVHDDVIQIIGAAERAANLVRQILTFSRKSEQEKRPLQIQPILKEALKLLRSSIPSTIEIVENIDPKCSPVLADPTQLHQVVMNLCTNAYHAMRDRPNAKNAANRDMILEVHLEQRDLIEEQTTQATTLQPGKYAILSVSDTGHGMDRATMERIFDPYFTTKEKGSGTGLGLATVLSIVEEHQGGVTVYSEPDVGTTFRIYIPVCAPEQLERIADGSPVEMAVHGSEHIMLVDDEPSILDLGRASLERLGYRVTTCANGIEALHLFSQSPSDFDIIVTDFTMPRMTGVELARNIVGIRPEIPILLCTGFSESLTDHRNRPVCIRAMIMKPIVGLKLAAAIRSVVDQKTA